MDKQKIEKHGFERVAEQPSIDKWRKVIQKPKRHTAGLEMRIAELTTGMFFCLYSKDFGRVWLNFVDWESYRAFENEIGAYWSPDMETAPNA